MAFNKGISDQGFKRLAKIAKTARMKTKMNETCVECGADIIQIKDEYGEWVWVCEDRPYYVGHGRAEDVAREEQEMAAYDERVEEMIRRDWEAGRD